MDTKKSQQTILTAVKYVMNKWINETLLFNVMNHDSSFQNHSLGLEVWRKG